MHIFTYETYPEIAASMTRRAAACANYAHPGANGAQRTGTASWGLWVIPLHDKAELPLQIEKRVGVIMSDGSH